VISDENCKHFPTLEYFAPLLKGFRLELGTGARGQKNYSDGVTVPRKKLDIFSRLDTIHERDEQTNGQRPDDSKDRDYA